ncbi:lactonase family protein [Lacticaseibacillus daqingensis]|uniref:lactonase family protein n=1 Tax=Lacticaseibacillus daqingensis TaxID=2486014 RepID=UPI000F77A418|nr:lactonase family protein [Lacticaseibacillus daqingensis]
MKQTVLLGGYTRKTGKGITRASFDSATGQLTTPVPYIESLGSPTYMAVSKANVAYAVDAGDGVGGVAAVDLNGATPTVLNTVLEPGSSPAHISIDEARQLVFASNYHEGRVNVYKINADHTLTPRDVAQHHGSGPRPEQDASHVHFADLTPDGRLAVIDLGTDEVYTYPLSDTGKLGTPVILKLAPGFGPRHLVFHHTRPIAYLLGELSSQVAVLTYDAATGTFLPGQTQSTIPADWTAHNGAAAVRLTQDDRFLYLSNRGHNSLTAYAVSEDGLHLTQIQQLSTEGEFPRDFNLDLTESYVLAVNQNTDNGTLYARDAATGLLTETQKDIVTPEAVNVVFLPAE